MANPPHFTSVEEANTWLDDEAGKRLRQAKRLRRTHALLAIGWAIMVPVSVITGLKNSVPYLVGLSVYALMVGHFSSWQSSRAEVSSETNPAQT